MMNFKFNKQVYFTFREREMKSVGSPKLLINKFHPNHFIEFNFQKSSILDYCQ